MTVGLGDIQSVGVFGWHTSDEGGVDIDLAVQKDGTDHVNFVPSNTVQVSGNIVVNKDVVGATVAIALYNLATDALISTLYSGSVNFTQATAKTFTAINGGTLPQYANPAPGLYYAKVAVSHADIQDADTECFFASLGVAPDATDDPFTQAYDAIWNYLEASNGFTSRVRLANRIKLTGTDKGPYKDKARWADLPEALLEPDTASVHFFKTNTGHGAEMVYNLRITSGALRLHASMFPVMWETFKALEDAGDTLGLSFVTKVRVGEFGISRDDTEANRGKKGWSAHLPIEVSFHFDRAWSLS